MYGAESYIGGFSGHVIDILVIHYKGFVKVLKAATTWKAKQVIDPEKYYRGKNPWLIMNKSKLQSPILIVDPLLRERNAAAALSKETMKKFVKAAQAFLKKPSKDFFAEKKVDLHALAKKAIVVEMTPLKGKEDVIGAKMMKAAKHISKALQPFAVEEKDWVWDRKGNAVFWWKVKKKSLTEKFDLPGPPVKMKQHVTAFKKKHRKTFVKKGKVFAAVKRKATTPEKAVELVCKEKYVKERTRRCSRK